MTIVHASPISAHNGFMLSSATEITGSVSVFVGKNGAGKTRFFESIKSGSTQIILNEEKLDPGTDITLIRPEEMNPTYGTHHDANNLNQNIINTIRSYQEIRHLVDLPYDPAHDMGRSARHPNQSYSHIYKLAQFIAKLANKKPSELSEDDINLNYAEFSSRVLGAHDVAGIFNRYMKKNNDNRYNKWRKMEEGEDVPTLSDDEFVKRFGPPPWEVINAILNATFEGKFYFPIPEDIKSKKYDHQTPLMESGGRIINIGELSSGEKTLLWLSISLFNAQYSERDLLPAPRLLLLDEPDAFLHPKMVERMYEVLREFHRAFGTVFWIITHSPTTTALAPADSLHLVHSTGIESIDKDAAVAELLDGISQIAILPENRRNVYVESHYDAAVFQELFEYLRKHSKKLDSKISMHFVPAGPRMPAEHLISKTKSILGITDEAKLQDFLTEINGSSSCSQVYAATQSISHADKLGIRGLVDWDLKNKPTDTVVVIGVDLFYTIENYILDPVCLILALSLHGSEKFSIERFSGLNLQWLDWLNDSKTIQKSLDGFLLYILDSPNNSDASIKYTSGLELKTDSRYARMNGHALERLLWERLPELNMFARQSREGELKFKIVKNIMINASLGRLIPLVIEEAFESLQK